MPYLSRDARFHGTREFVTPRLRNRTGNKHGDLVELRRMFGQNVDAFIYSTFIEQRLVTKLPRRHSVFL